ncbi:MAG: inorganic phosphate transporter [Bacilli bacterium]|nr:inorganic phosphate transporter [Bacilli bacterium]MDD4077268.1 inorganic phosphate transporter [Bacilli bacterium]MDD4388751.1 inorganic phosphate transporter [Bacilli bacterium]
MSIDFSEFINHLISNPIFLLTIILILAVILINGWTDAPNAIATCVSTKAISPRNAIILATVFNFLGVFIMTMFNSKVAATIYNMVDFGGDTTQALTALSAAMIGIVIWATLAWYFGIPTSESHALIAGISGAAIALQNGFSGINPDEWVKVLYGIALSTVLGFGSGWLIVKALELIFKNVRRRKAQNFFKKGQIGGAAAMAFMHGAQDGQKFMGVFMLSIFLSQGQYQVTEFFIPVWLMILSSVVMAFGTSIGGYRIIKTVGMDMVRLEQYQGFATDIAAAGSLLLSSVWGIPVSTTHMKTTAIMGVGSAKRLSAVKWNVVGDLVLTWILTFPGCGLIGYAMAKLFMLIF